MFATNTLIALLVSSVPLFVGAIVGPTVPAPGGVYNEGASCPIAWTGDTNSTTVWKSMTIQLMTGSNTEMVALTTVAVSQDGTVAGQFSYPCPKVIPNSAIYFYQFSSLLTPDLTWTTRFAIASSTGETVPPANANQPDGEPIPWGIGKLASASVSLNSSSLPSSSTSNSASSGSASTISSPSLTNTITTSGPSPTSVSLSSSGTEASSPAQTSTTSGASVAMTAFDIRILGAVAAATLALSFVW